MGRSICAWMILLLSCQPALAGLRCQERLVSRGSTLFEVRERCGVPGFAASRVDYRYPGIWVHVDEWVYERRSNKFRRLLTFENGRLVDIELRSKPIRSLRESVDY